jgi:uncharacterized membrane protein YphA (DoxX/SURF4 family)
MRWLLSTDASVIQLVLRWTLAIVMFPHGAQKVLGWFGGYGFKGTMGYFRSSRRRSASWRSWPSSWGRSASPSAS